MDDCNSCSCDESGQLARCTAMACDPNERNKREIPLKTQFTEAETRSKDFRCEANANVKVDCNTCKCAADGKSLTWCTLIGCYFDDSVFANRTKRDDNSAYEKLERKGSILNPYTEDEVKQPGFKCEPDSSLKVGCRRCTCANDGKSVDFCIETTCYSRNGNKGSTRSPEEYAKLSNKGHLLNPYTEDETKLPSFKCTPDSSVKVDCKRCLCGDDGKTLTYCVDVSCYKVKNRSRRSRKAKCGRGDNQQTVRPDYEPTASPDSDDDEEDDDTPYNEEDSKSRFPVNCRNYSKTRDTNCPKGSPANSFFSASTNTIRCKNNDAFWVECNTCWCSNGKVGFCTRKSCQPKIYGTLPTTTTTTMSPFTEQI